MSYLLPLLAYLFGSISSAVMVARLLDLPDPRTVGSGNPGATNILRLGSKGGAALTLTGDVLKGLLPVLLARVLSDDPVILASTAVGAFIGHLFPIFFAFQGGKGVATGLGVYLALSPWLGVALVGTWLAVALLFRYSSLAAMATAALSPLLTHLLLPGLPYLLLSVVLAVLLLWRHRSNLRRLLAGDEDRMTLRRR
jgi:glycerol-3-phosphate acyltransferase PlsY